MAGRNKQRRRDRSGRKSKAARHQPAQEGTSALESPAPEFQVAFKKVSQAANLADLLNEYTFFTPAILFCVGQLDRDPMGDFVQAQEGQVELFNLPFSDKIFSGLSDMVEPQNKWNSYLFGVQQDKTVEFDQFMMEVGIIDWERKYFASVLSRRIQIVDPLAKRRLVSIPEGGWPMVEIIAYGLRANTHTAMLMEAADPARGLPQLQLFKPEPEVKAEGQRLFAGGHDKFFRDMESRDESAD